MNIKKMLFFILPFFLMACSAYTPLAPINSAINVYQGAKVAYNGYNAYKMVKGMQDADPVFIDYQGVEFKNRIHPADGDKISIERAFNQEAQRYAGEVLNIAKLDNVKTCIQRCDGIKKILVVQFKEDTYGRTLAGRILAGELIRGKLYFMDKDSGEVIRETPLEDAKKYSDLLHELDMTLAYSVVKSAGIKDKKDINDIIDGLNEIPIIRDKRNAKILAGR